MIRRVTVAEDWPERWPCSVFRPNDVIEAVFAGNGDLVAFTTMRSGVLVTLEPESAELDSVLIDGRIRS